MPTADIGAPVNLSHKVGQDGIRTCGVEEQQLLKFAIR